MPRLSASRKGSDTSDSQLHSSLPSDDVLYLSSADWVTDLSLISPYPTNMPLPLGPSTQSTLQLIPLSPLSQTSHHQLFSNMQVPTLENSQYVTVNSQLPWSTDPLLVPSFHTDFSSQGSSPSEARLNSESPSLQDAEGEEETLEEPTTETKKPKRSRPNRYKNAPPAVIQRRRAANRKSQRAYRKRKDDRIAELEELLDQATRREIEMGNTYMTLRAEYENLLMIGSQSNSNSNSNQSHHHHHHGRSLSTASTATTTATSTTTPATSEEEEAASTFMALAAFAHNNRSSSHHHHHHQSPIGLSPQMAHPQHPHQSAATSPHRLSVYPPPPM